MAHPSARPGSLSDDQPAAPYQEDRVGPTTHPPWHVWFAALMIVGAMLVPVGRIDSHKARRLAAFRAEVLREAAQRTPVDDTYITWGSDPYPISSGGILRLFLVADGLILASGVWRRWFVAESGHGTSVGLWPRGEGRVVLALTLLGGFVRAIG